MELTTVWFALVAILWIGYFCLEGFDFGVGMLLPILSKDEKERRVLYNTIGPVWDGNEVWVLTAGGAIFASFPLWYATLFSGFFIPLLLILVALIVRNLAFDYRGKRDDDTWRRRWDWMIIGSAWVPSILWGVAFANLVRGVKLDADHQYIGSFWDLLSPFALLGGAVTLILFLSHGAIFLSLKTDGIVKERATALAKRFSLIAIPVTAAWALWAQIAYSNAGWTWAVVAVAAQPGEEEPGAAEDGSEPEARRRSGGGDAEVRARARRLPAQGGDAAEDPQRQRLDLDPLALRDDRVGQLVRQQRAHEQHRSDGPDQPVRRRAVARRGVGQHALGQSPREQDDDHEDAPVHRDREPRHPPQPQAVTHLRPPPLHDAARGPPRAPPLRPACAAGRVRR